MRKISLRPTSRRSSHAQPGADRPTGLLVQAPSGGVSLESAQAAKVFSTQCGPSAPAGPAGRCRRRRVRSVGLAQPVRPHPQRPRAQPVSAEDPPQPGLGQRLPGGRTAQHHEALRCAAARRPFLTQVGGQLGEERAVHRDDPLLAALPVTRTRRSPTSTSASRSDRTSAARSPPSSISKVITRSRKLCRSARNTATSSGSSDSGGRRRLAHQPPTAARPPRPYMPEQPRPLDKSVRPGEASIWAISLDRFKTTRGTR
jgi:hypothetical protein